MHFRFIKIEKLAKLGEEFCTFQSCKVDGFFSEVNSKATKNEDKLDGCNKYFLY